jgi:MoxR-like ATPase
VSAAPGELRPEDAARLGDAILAEVGRAVVGKRDAVALVLVGLLAGGHVLLEDYPGVAKTLIVRSLAQVLDLRFSRVQFTPDLMPADLTGFSAYDRRTAELVFRPGPLFANLVLGDEVNRAPPKTQAALLEAMQERQVTVDGVSRPLPEPFVVVATQNPIEFEGTYPLPEAQLDRFMLRVRVGYPDREAEAEVLARRVERGQDEVHLERVVSPDALAALRRGVERVRVAPAVARYVVDIVRETREAPGVLVGASPRAGLALLLAARARATLEGRDFVVPDDVKALALPALAHRLALRPELWLRGEKAEEIVAECVGRVAVPVAQDVGKGATNPP